MNKDFSLIGYLQIFWVTLAIASCGGGSTVTQSPDVAGIEMGAALAANGEQESRHYTVELSGSQALPPVDTRHTGLAEFTADTITGQLFGTVTTSLAADADGIAEVHIREGGPDEVGSDVVRLIEAAGNAGNKVFNVPANFFLAPQQLTSYNNGGLYVDIHAGSIEIRGQLSDEPPFLALVSELGDLQAKLFTPMCSGCHTGSGNSLPAVMNLSTADATYNSLVGVFSIGEPELLRVDPGDADNSLVMHKVLGTQSVGSRMPFRGAKLDAQIIDALSNWINAGAPR